MINQFKLEEILDKEELHRYQSEIIQEDHVSRYYQSDNIAILTLRGFAIEDESLETISTNFIFKNNEAYQYDVNKKILVILKDKYQSILKTIIATDRDNTEILNAYYNQVDELEDSVFDRSFPRHFMEMWFDLKKSILKIERYYLRCVSALKDYEKAHFKNSDFHRASFHHTLEKMKANHGQATGLVSKLDTIYHYYNSIKNDRLNQNIYLLTLLSGLFLPLNLIVGFFGMNTENLFFKDQSQGTLYVTFILVGVFFLFTVGFRLLYVVDRLLLKSGLGKYKIYQLVSNKLKTIEKVIDTSQS